MLADALVAAVDALLKDDPDARIRILEVGAGTGGTTAALLPRLAPFRLNIVEYAYTDLSKAFLFHAEEQFVGAYPFVQPKLFDIEKPLAGQGIEAQRYDFVIATNVLHATRDIRRTLANCKAALARNGLLLLNEIGTPSLFAHLTFGLLEGWWLAQDQALRMPDAPGLFPATWQTVLKQEGFPAVFFSAPDSHVLGQQVIVAESDGVVWQEEAVAMPSPAKSIAPRAVASSAVPETPKAAANTLLRKLVARTLRMDAGEVDVHEPLEAYGIDSILVVQIVDALRESFSDVRSTLLFECQTVDALAEHFVRHHPDEVARLTGVRAEAVVAPAVRSNIRESPAVADDSIAVIGMSCRFPQAPTVEAFWQLLKSGRDCVGEIPKDRWPLEGFFHADLDEAVQRGKSYAKWGAFLDGVTEFDPLFFNISPKDAVAIDPQERLFLQTAWEALEDAGYTRQRLAQDFDRRLGVFVGITRTGFDLFGPELWRRGETLYPHTSFSSVANRLSYFLDARGPSVPVDTMCSSSLTAIHQACQSLSSGECRLAIAGGVNVYLHPSGYVGLSASRMLSKDGLCRSFGKGGDGFVPGEGVAAVLLKPLSRAIADGDRIHAVIRATHVNHGGKTNGYTVPNPQAQAELVREAIEKAGVDARAVTYMEAHGTGTELGDPIEVTGLTQAFRHFTQDTGFCALGSAKTNIGHLEAAAGIAGFIKVVLQMQHRQLVPSLHSAELNPGIDFARTPFVVQQRLEEWRATGPRLAGVSSFGAGGANAHVIVEEYAAPAPATAASPHGAVIVLSARNEDRLKVHVGRLRDFIASSAPDLSDLAYTLQVGREQMEQRLALVVHSVDELRQRLEAWLNGAGEAGELYVGNAKQHRELISAFANDAAMQETIGVWLARGEHARVLGLWSKGLNVDWRVLHPAPGRLIGLPTYPFEMTRYWLPDLDQEKVEERPAVARPQGIKLQDPALLPTTFAVDTAVRQHMLRPLASYAPAEEAALSVRDLGDGILAIGAQGQASAAGARAGLAACIDWVNASPPKVLVLGGLDRLFPGGDAEALATLANCIVPTIALPDAGSMAVACDIAAANEEVALATARDIARASTTALVELKRNLSRAAAKGSDTAWPATPAVAAVYPLERVALRSKVVTLDRQPNGVVVMTLCDRTARNTSSPDLVNGVIEAFEHIKATPAYKAVVLTGYDTYFACGGTKEGLLAIQSGAIRFTDEQSYALPLACDIPVIAAMQGHGIGAGWAMGLFCDWAVYSEESVYRSPYMLYGFTPGAGSTLVFPQRLGDGLAREILFTARDFTGRDLKQRGIDMPVVPRKDVVAMHDKTFVGNAQVVANVERHFNVGTAQEEAVHSPKAGGPAPDRASQQEVLETLAQSLADELLMRREQVDETAAFTDIGMDSISAVMWVKKINSRFGLSLTATKVYHYPSLKQFADFVLSQMGDRQPVGAAEPAPAEPPKPPRASAPIRTFALVEWPQEGERPQEIVPREISPAIAIIGMAGQFPKAPNVKQFWRNIAEGRECVSEIPSSRWSIDAYYDPDRSAAGKTVCRRMGFLDDVDLFDPLFFNISPSEAELMDPQQRLFLQSSWHCIEDAGYNPKDLSGTSCGVFVGCAASDYSQLVAGGANSAQALIGESVSILPARIAYFLNLQGPCLAIDTACSASLVALATACDSLVLRNSDIALAGGVYVINGPDIHVKMSSAGMLSPDGRCFSFDQRANGFVPGEGVGVVLLKRLVDAERDGDDIYAVVRGWGANQDGKTNGITAPNQESQTRLEAGIYRKFGIDPEHIQLVEAHGTGTKLGDPIEVDALCSSFRQFTGKEQFCALGSVKTNIGHLATAAGVAGVIKSVLALQRKQLPPTINYQSLNEHIRLQGSPFYVNTECRPWPADAGRKRLAAVSSFGFSGTNAHVVLEEYAPRRPVVQNAVATPLLLSLSARSREQLAVYARAVADYLGNDHEPREVSLADLAYGFRVGRPLFEHRATFAARSFDELRQQLERYVATGETVVLPSQAIDAGEGRRRHGLPAYPFERERYWAAPATSDEWQAAELTDAVDWQGRLRHILSQQILVVHANEGTRNAFDRLLVQLKQAAGVEKASVTYCVPAGLTAATATLRPGHVVHLDEGAVVVGGQRRLVVGQSDRGDLNVVMQRLFKEWLAFDVSGARLREIRYAGARRLVRWAAAEEVSGSICTLAKEWRLKAPEPLAQPPRRGTLLLLVNAETAPFAARLLEKDFDELIVVDETNLGDERLVERHDSITHIVDLSDLHGEPADSDGDPSGKVALYQRLVGAGGDLSILYLTKGLQSFRSTRLSLAGAKFAGLVRMLSAEYRHVNARCLDIDQLVLDEPQRLRRILLQEFEAGLQETELCYREGHRFAPVLTAVESDDPAPGALRIDPAAVYVISGGTNGVGLEIAKILAGRGCRKLVLMGITELPPKESWSAAVAKGDLSPYVATKLGELIALDKRLDHLGIYTGALTAQAALRSYFVKVRATVGPIRGVVHGAAVYSDAGAPGFAGKSPARMREVWDVKMGGLESLQAIFKADPLDFFVAFSSMTALVPRLARGASDYAMANGFVEFFTAYHRSRPGGERFRSIMWSDWNQTGAITRIAADRARAVMETFERLGLRTFSNQEGAALFELAMTGAEAVSVVAYLDRERFDEAAPHLLLADPDSPDGPRLPVAARPQSLKAVPRSILHQLDQWEAEKRAGGRIPIERILEVIGLEEIKQIDPVQIHRLHEVMFGETAQMAQVDPPVDHAGIVAATVRDVLKLKSVDPAKPFQDYGLDSISATVLATRLEKKLKREVQPKWLIDFPTVDALVRFLGTEDEASMPRAAAPSTPAE
ncbi:MAG: beta-ketoacyl synthase N-terminal-like domain-containing protein [Alphaproteobacteria bacterium]|nr:beta-ketoacyl synthase N-terminal-like domain-containing protein [Alphaproteobacteria bacterium]